MQKMRAFWTKITSFYPTMLPQTDAEFLPYCDSIIQMAGLTPNDSHRHAIATMIMHLPPTRHTVPKHFFIASLRKAVSNEIAYFRIKEMKAQADLEAKQKLEAEAKSKQDATEEQIATKELAANDPSL